MFLLWITVERVRLLISLYLIASGGRHGNVLDKSVFVENMHKCAQIGMSDTASLLRGTRAGCEFGIDFEISYEIRKDLQLLFGFGEMPNLKHMTKLCCDLLVVGLCNLAVSDAVYMEELEQWFEFLLDFYSQEVEERQRGVDQLSDTFPLVSDGRKSSSARQSPSFPSTPLSTSENSNSRPSSPLQELETDSRLSTESSPLHIDDTVCQTMDTLDVVDEDRLFQQQMKEALDNYRCRKRQPRTRTRAKFEKVYFMH